MSVSRVRYVGGDTNKVSHIPDPAFPFNKGDLLFQYDSTWETDARFVNGRVYPATALLPEATIEENQLAFARNFAGVADEDYGLGSATGAYTAKMTFNPDLAGAQKSVSVCTGGRFEFVCPSQTFIANQAVGICARAGDTIQDAATVDALSGSKTPSAMIGTVVQQAAAAENPTANTPQTRVVVEIRVSRPYATAPAAGTYTSATSGQ